VDGRPEVWRLCSGRLFDKSQYFVKGGVVMLHLVPLAVAILFLNMLTGYSFAILVWIINLVGLRLSASGVLAISLQVAFTVLALGINVLAVDFRKYLSARRLLHESKRLSYLVSILVITFWIFLLVTDYSAFAALPLAAGLEQFKTTISIISIGIRWSVAVAFSVTIYFLVTNIFEFLKES
jgi:hypothetical protein